jgi:hypothetical protein
MSRRHSTVSCEQQTSRDPKCSDENVNTDKIIATCMLTQKVQSPTGEHVQTDILIFLPVV